MPPGQQLVKFLASHFSSNARHAPHRGGLRASLIQVSQVHGSSGESTSGDTALASRGPYAAKLKTRGVIRFDGPDVVHFLQGLVTNDVGKFEASPPATSGSLPSPNAAAAHYPPLYTALLNSQGRFLYDLFLYKPTAPNEKLDQTGSGPGEKGEDVPALLADVDVGVVDEIMAYLKKHRLRAKVDMQDISQDLAVWQHFGGVLAEKPKENSKVESGSMGYGGSEDDNANAAAQTDAGGFRWYKDPRLSALGMRGLFPHNTPPPLVEADESVEDNYYLLWRLEQGVAEGSVEIPKGEAIPLEYNLAGLNAISFEKGCYVGQELVARTHHRGVIRKRLMPVNFVMGNGEEAQQAVTPGADVVDKSTGKKVGKVTTVLGPRGLALLRLEAGLKDNAQLQIENYNDILVKAVRPKWWQSDWGQEDEQHAASNS